MTRTRPPHPPHNRPVKMPNRAVWDFWKAMDAALAEYRRERALFGEMADAEALTEIATIDGPRLEQLMMDMEAESQHLMAGADNIRKLLKRVETGVVSPATVAVLATPEAKA